MMSSDVIIPGPHHHDHDSDDDISNCTAAAADEALEISDACQSPAWPWSVGPARHLAQDVPRLRQRPSQGQCSCQWMCVPLKLICTCASESTVRSQYAVLNFLNRYIKSWLWVPRAGRPGPAATVQACPCNFKISWIFENAERDATKRSVLCSYKGITSESIGNFLILIDKRFTMWSEFRGSRCSHYASAGKTILHWLRQSLKCQSRCARNIICGNWLWEYPVKEQIWIMLS